MIIEKTNSDFLELYQKLKEGIKSLEKNEIFSSDQIYSELENI